MSLFDDEDVARLRGVTVIDGDLHISGRVTDLSPLGHLTEVTGDLYHTTALVDLDGLRGLRTVGKYLMIRANEALRKAELRSLTTVTESLAVAWHCSGNPRLAEISFPSLTRVGALGVSREPGGLEGDGSSCWHTDSPRGPTQVAAVRVRPFRRLEWIGEPAKLVEEAPGLFPALRSTGEKPPP